MVRKRLRAVAVAAVVPAFFGTVAFAPFSVSSAEAYERWSAASSPGGSQTLRSAEAAGQVVDLSVSVAGGSSGALYTLQQFMSSGVVNWGGYRFTYYSQQVLPGQGLQISGRHVNDDGYVSDGDGYIVLAGSAPKGTVFNTPFGYQGKIYDRGTFGNHLDVYIR